MAASGSGADETTYNIADKIITDEQYKHLTEESKLLKLPDSIGKEAVFLLLCVCDTLHDAGSKSNRVPQGGDSYTLEYIWKYLTSKGYVSGEVPSSRLELTKELLMISNKGSFERRCERLFETIIPSLNKNLTKYITYNDIVSNANVNSYVTNLRNIYDNVEITMNEVYDDFDGDAEIYDDNYNTTILNGTDSVENQKLESKIFGRGYTIEKNKVSEFIIRFFNNTQGTLDTKSIGFSFDAGEQHIGKLFRDSQNFNDNEKRNKNVVYKYVTHTNIADSSTSDRKGSKFIDTTYEEVSQGEVYKFQSNIFSKDYIGLQITPNGYVNRFNVVTTNPYSSEEIIVKEHQTKESESYTNNMGYSIHDILCAIIKIHSQSNDMCSGTQYSRLLEFIKQYKKNFGEDTEQLTGLLLDLKRSGDYEQVFKLIGKPNNVIASIDILCILIARILKIPSILQIGSNISLYKGLQIDLTPEQKLAREIEIAKNICILYGQNSVTYINVFEYIFSGLKNVVNKIDERPFGNQLKKDRNVDMIVKTLLQVKIYDIMFECLELLVKLDELTHSFNNLDKVEIDDITRAGELIRIITKTGGLNDILRRCKFNFGDAIKDILTVDANVDFGTKKNGIIPKFLRYNTETDSYRFNIENITLFDFNTSHYYHIGICLDKIIQRYGSKSPDVSSRSSTYAYNDFIYGYPFKTFTEKYSNPYANVKGKRITFYDIINEINNSLYSELFRYHLETCITDININNSQILADFLQIKLVNGQNKIVETDDTDVGMYKNLSNFITILNTEFSSETRITLHSGKTTEYHNELDIEDSVKTLTQTSAGGAADGQRGGGVNNIQLQREFNNKLSTYSFNREIQSLPFIVTELSKQTGIDISFTSHNGEIKYASQSDGMKPEEYLLFIFTESFAKAIHKFYNITDERKQQNDVGIDTEMESTNKQNNTFNDDDRFMLLLDKKSSMSDKYDKESSYRKVESPPPKNNTSIVDQIGDFLSSFSLNSTQTYTPISVSAGGKRKRIRNTRRNKSHYRKQANRKRTHRNDKRYKNKTMKKYKK